MKRIKVLLISLLFSVSFIFAQETERVIAISSDGAQGSYLLAQVQRIDMTITETSTSMTVLCKNNYSQTGVQKILFSTPITEIKEIGVNNVYVYPNPVSHTLYIEGVSDETPLYIFNLAGQCIGQEYGSQIDVTFLQQGTYILRINQQHVKFIKK